MRTLHLVAIATTLTLSTSSALRAQTLDLNVKGGSVPGTLTWEMSGGRDGQIASLILSVSSGPTSLFPLDPRSLRVGLESIGLTQSGPFLNGTATYPSVPIPNDPTLVGTGFFLQGLSLIALNGNLIDGISQPRAVRFDAARTFVDRFRQFTTPRSFFHVVPADEEGRIMLPGGGSGAVFAQIARKSTQIFDPIDESFVPGPDMLRPRSLHTVTRLDDGRYLFTGGVDDNNDPQADCEIWDPATGQFTMAASMIDSRMAHAAFLRPDGKVVVSGGIPDLNFPPAFPIDPIYRTLTKTEIYDPATNMWTQGPDLRRRRAGHGVWQRPDGTFLIFGGIGVSGIILPLPTVEATCDIYDPVSNTISAGPNLRQSRSIPAQIQISENELLVAGGVGTISLTQFGTPTNRAEIYDFRTNSWTATTGNLSQQRVLCDLLPTDDGRFVLAGGADGTLFALTALNSSEVWDPATGTWSAGPTLNQLRAAYEAYETATGQWHLCGGSGGMIGIDNTTEFFYR